MKHEEYDIPIPLVLALDSWSPSYDRLHEDRPTSFDTSCECWECLAKTPAERQQDAEWEWRCGGRVSCRLMLFEPPYDPNQWIKRKHHAFNPEEARWPEPLYQAKVSFCGAGLSGMERYFVYEEDARWFVCHLPVFVTKEWLLSQGFIWA